MKSAISRLSRERILSFGPVCFAEGDGGTGGTGGTGAPPEGTGGTGGQNSQDDKGKTGGAGKSDDDLDSITDPEELRRKLRNRAEQAQRQDRELAQLREAARERDELKTKQEEIERKDRTDLENAQRDLETHKTRADTLAETVKRLTMELAFMRVKDVDWYDPDDALRLVDLSDVQFDEKTGEPKDASKLVDAAKKLAKDKPHLVKPKTAVPNGTPAGKPSGAPPAAGAPLGSDKDRIRGKYNIRT
jgi:hypothetical protein